jgi:NADH:ubiquinone oxidoreductase subunit 5 (subunit L)/multisubunit Na+/H+ antiporter MnhA subunit
LAVLSVGSIFFGYFMKDLFIGQGSSFWSGIIFISDSKQDAQLVGEFLPFYIKIIPFFGAVIAISFVFIINSPALSEMLNISKYAPMYRFLSHKWYFDTVYNHFVNTPLLKTAYLSIFKALDKGLIESWGPTGASRLIYQLSALLTKTQTGYVQDYSRVIILIAVIWVLYESS